MHRVSAVLPSTLKYQGAARKCLARADERWDEMAVAGFCKQCGSNVYLDDRWCCVSGHPWTEIVDWYDPQTGMAVTPYWLQPASVQAPPVAPPAEQLASAPQPPAAPEPQPEEAPAPVSADTASGTRDALLTDLMATFAQYPGYRLAYGTDTDVLIDNQVADANWGTGKKKIEYEAILKAVEPERTVYFWEILKEKGAGLSFGGMESESYSTFGAKRSGKTKQVVIGPGGVAMDAEWDYGATRRIVEDVAARHGFQVKVVLRKRSAQW